MVMFCFRPLFPSFVQKSIEHFDVHRLIFQQFIHRDLKPVAFPVLKLKSIRQVILELYLYIFPPKKL